MEQKSNILKTTIIVILLIIIFSFTTLVNLITDYWWFDSLGFSQLFMITLKSKIFLFIISFLFILAFISFNLWLASRITKSKSTFKIGVLISIFVSLIAGYSTSQAWFKFLQYMNQSSFNLNDPIFMKDASFYVFSLPFLNVLAGFLIACVVLSLIAVGITYFKSFLKEYFTQTQSPGIDPNNPSKPMQNVTFRSAFKDLKKHSIIHLGVLGSLFFILLAFTHFLSRFSIMYSRMGDVFGASYSDIVGFLPVMNILMYVSVLIAIVLLFVVFSKSSRYGFFIGMITIYVIILLVGPTLVPSLIQSLVVSPNEFSLEKPYIENNINFTRQGYGLSDVEHRFFDVRTNLTRSSIENANSTVDNLRILDTRPLKQTYKQTQEIRLYYDLSSIDVDRYNISGDYTQVLVSAREMDQRQLPDKAKTWVNEHLVYTHGYGLVMSPVNTVTKSGLPNYIIKDVPPTYNTNDTGLRINRPEIYYGESESDYVLANTKVREFDFPKGDKNQYTNYEGDGGVEIDGFFKKLMYSIKFGDFKLLLTSQTKPDSRIMFNRNIQQRIKKLTPFLSLDSDPYIVINDGRLHWVQDAYTTTDNFPYSESNNGLNYVRNSVKVVVDAYSGDVNYYVVEEDDALIDTYSNIYPDTFEPISNMDEELRDHVRYPLDLFRIQSKMYSDFHMDDPKVFYNKEDSWEIPKEIFGTGQQVLVEPYYAILELPDEEEGEYVLMNTFTPVRKDNMVSWLAGRSDGEDYGQLVNFRFPKDKLVHGTSQIEAQIDQNSRISEQLTLWSQSGSQVKRGHLLVIPVDDGILYIEPLYIQSDRGSIPQLKRVIVSDGDDIVMRKNLSVALEVLLGEREKVVPSRTINRTETDIVKTNKELIEKAQRYYDNIISSAGENWSGFGDNLNKLGEVLNQLTQDGE